MKNEKNVFKVFQSIQNYKVFFSFLLHSSCFVMHILNFLNTKTSANWFSFMIDSEDLILSTAGIFPLIWKDLYETLFPGKTLCSDEQSVQEMSLLEIFLLTQKW